MAVDLTSLTDDQAGDLNGRNDCATGGEILPSGSYSCSFTEALSGEAGSTPTNDEPAQVDLNCFNRADNVQGHLGIQWTWDDTDSC